MVSAPAELASWYSTKVRVSSARAWSKRQRDASAAALAALTFSLDFAQEATAALDSASAACALAVAASVLIWASSLVRSLLSFSMCACRAFVISCAAAFSKKDLVSARFCSTSGRVQRKESSRPKLSQIFCTLAICSGCICNSSLTSARRIVVADLQRSSSMCPTRSWASAVLRAASASAADFCMASLSILAASSAERHMASCSSARSTSLSLCETVLAVFWLCLAASRTCSLAACFSCKSRSRRLTSKSFSTSPMKLESAT
mmetsp:Transcript_70225/g.164430  ORF Transcript_70225/g.164430 Transcript_70225/m.164430 type:complete len:262 (-) Transcript_70225:230-1015(-)